MKNEKWSALELAQVERKLKTNAASGLSRKAARSRYRKSAGCLFKIPTKTPLRMLGELVSDFALIILLLAAVVSLCFEEYRSAWTVLALMSGNLVFAWILYFRCNRSMESLASFF